MTESTLPTNIQSDKSDREGVLTPVQPQNIDRTGPELPQIAGRGFHMPTEVLGRESPTQQQTGKHHDRSNILADVNIRARKRSNIAVRASKSQAAVAAAAAKAKAAPAIEREFPVGLDSAMFTLVTYEGMEVIFATTAKKVVGVCSRNHLLFQELDLASTAPVVSISSNSYSGMIIIAHEDGVIKTYKPTRNHPHDIEDCKQGDALPSLFGKFRWVDCLTINAREIFYQPDEAVEFRDRREARPGELVDVSSSGDHKVLVAHRNQLAVFETDVISGDSRVADGSSNSTLLWTTILPEKIVTAKISGDGRALVAVLDSPNNDGSYGAKTFLHDIDDGSNPLARPPLERSPSVGMVYKPGPFLQHSTPITRISFRGLGHATSATNGDGEEGNDLLLTYCEEDSTVRIFNQNGWQQLMLWSAPPSSRADWIRGASAFSLGDLESQKKPKNQSSKAISRHPSGASIAEVSAASSASGGIRNVRSLGSGVPTTAAGAWIAEVTFRNAFPALRLSRLSYMKRGADDSQPAHFESVAAILPAGSITPSSVLNSDDMGLSVQGVWPAWNPWLSETSDADSSDSLSGSAMQFLGLSSTPPPSSAYFGDSYLGGTHSPPTELRVVASHPEMGKIVLMEFPLWGDEDFGAMELGSPIRNVLSLQDSASSRNVVGALREGPDMRNGMWSSMNYESSRLCARLDHRTNAVSLLWRKQGTMSFFSPDWRDEQSIVKRPGSDRAEPPAPELFFDLSICPVPYSLPSIQLPDSPENVAAITWWPDESFGGPPLLLVMTFSATLYLFEIPPPWCSQEPGMPNYDPFNASASNGSLSEIYDPGLPDFGSDEEDEIEVARQEYEVVVTPHPDFGLGLRLESPMDGLPAVAGSFKKHPLNGGMLPAEKTGMIILGDELLSVNGVSLEKLTFDDIIATVRHVGAEAGPGGPLSLRFRPSPPDRVRRNSAVLHESFNSRRADSASLERDPSRRSVMGVSQKNQKKKEASSHKRRSSDGGSQASVLVGSSGEEQQEFSRLIATINNALPSVDGDDFRNRFVLVPWQRGQGTPPHDLRGAALIAAAVGSEVHVLRLELPAEHHAGKAKVRTIGTVDVSNSSLVPDDAEQEQKSALGILTIKMIQSAGEEKCLLALDNHGTLRLIYVTIEKEKKEWSTSYRATFRHFRIIERTGDPTGIDIRAPSPSLIGLLDSQDGSLQQSISIWTARADPSCRALSSIDAVKDDLFGTDYWQSEVEIVPSVRGSRIIDYEFIVTGFLDTFPALAVYLQTEVIVYQRRGGSRRWLAILRFHYALRPGSSPELFMPEVFQLDTSAAPTDAYPHLVDAVITMLPSYDEHEGMLSDWNPESLLAHICSDETGAEASLRYHAVSILQWLADCVGGDTPEGGEAGTFPLLVAPINVIRRGCSSDQQPVPEVKDSAEDFASMFGSGTGSQREDAGLVKIRRLLECLSGTQNIELDSDPKRRLSSKRFGGLPASDDEANTLPAVLKFLGCQERRVLWTIASVAVNPPDFKNLDRPGQLALAIHALHVAIGTSPFKKSTDRATNQGQGRKSGSSVLVKRQLSNAAADEPKVPPPNASAGCAAALFSNFQGLLWDCICSSNSKIDWPTARQLRAPFWLRSDEKLRQISEQIGQNLYRESRDILNCAIFFIIAGKKRTLRNLAAADNSESGKKFFKFLTSFDFSSARGRSAAEKNAFSLLRKNKYLSASAFFLLAEPPGLKSAVETIATKVQDVDLAFMVARLVESLGTSNGGGFNSGSSWGMGGMAGGGYASAGLQADSQGSKDKELFSQWNPKLGKGARELLLDRGLPNSRGDACFYAIQLMWLGRVDEASHWLSGYVECKEGLMPSFSEVAKLPRLRHAENVTRQSMDPTLSHMNRFIDFVSGPTLLGFMNASARTRIATTIHVSSLLCAHGIEIPAFSSLVANYHDDSNPVSPESGTNLHGTEGGGVASTVQTWTSTPAVKPPSDGASSSIFDSFDVPTPQHRGKDQGAGSTGGGLVRSSIFSSFDAPGQNNKEPAPAAGGEMSSSIFDDFDAPRRPPKQQPGIPSGGGGQPESSIFSAFDVRSQNNKYAPASSSQGMASSIFDDFDVPNRQPKPHANTPSTGGGLGQSSIFSAFDVPGQNNEQTTPTASGEMTSSIFDDFDVPTRPAKATPTAGKHLRPPGPSDMQSSIFDDYNHPSSFTTDRPRVDAVVSQVAAADSTLPLGPVREPSDLWKKWREQIVVDLASRRVVREVASVCGRFHVDTFEPFISLSDKSSHSLIPSNAAEVLQFHCDGEGLVKDVNDRVNSISATFGVEATQLVRQSLSLLESPFQFHRVFYSALLHLVLQEVELAEDVVRNAARALIERCVALSISNDELASDRLSMSFISSIPLRRVASHMCWQLELCLWMHRGGALPLSGIALNEAICAVRIGLLVASWNCDFECLETMIRQPPDCLVDAERGRQLWSSLKIISSNVSKDKKTNGISSGGWEFLVDCRRAEATELLRLRPTGCFIIRPHPDDHGVFTLSFKTNLVPSAEPGAQDAPPEEASDSSEPDNKRSKNTQKHSRPVKRDEVVQHAIIRLSDSGFRCGSFGPFATLMKLLEAVSSSLPFDLRFDQPPIEGVIKEEGSKPSPNSAFYRKLCLSQTEALNTLRPFATQHGVGASNQYLAEHSISGDAVDPRVLQDNDRGGKFGKFMALLTLSELRKQLSSVAASKYEFSGLVDSAEGEGSLCSVSEMSNDVGPENDFAVASRVLRPLLSWCRTMEVAVQSELAPDLKENTTQTDFLPVALNASETAIEISTAVSSGGMDGGDAVIRRIIQPDSGVEFRTLRLGDGVDSAMVVLFSKKEAVSWFVSNSVEKTEADALKRLQAMELSRVIEPIDLKLLAPKAYKNSKHGDDDGEPDTSTEVIAKGIRYRLVDPWEVEPLGSREAETKGASLGRHRFLAFSLGRVAASCERIFRSIGGLHLLELWATARGGVSLTKALATVHPPWERDSGGDLRLHRGTVAEPVAYVNSIRQHLYRNALFRELGLPQRFLALVQVELLDLKNLTSPGGSLSLTVYSLLRLKRARSGAPLTVKARTLDSVSTQPIKLGKSTGPNAPASWGSVVRFRFPLPEYTTADGRSYDGDREALFKGPPSVLQVSVYEKKFMSDTFLGEADVKLDGLSAGGQLEEWVPLRTETHGINWFARIRLTLRFELMCMAPDGENLEGMNELAPSVGLRRIHQLSTIGGAQEDLKKSVSTPDLLSYFESMVS